MFACQEAIVERQTPGSGEDRDRAEAQTWEGGGHNPPGAGMNTLERFIGEICAEPQPLLANTSGTLLFEIRDNNETVWALVTVDKSRVGVEEIPGSRDADATIRADRALIDAIAAGRANAMAAVLRGEMRVEGDAELLMDFQRIFPGPDDPRQP
jgi:putative sterol carrier protein